MDPRIKRTYEDVVRDLEFNQQTIDIWQKRVDQAQTMIVGARIKRDGLLEMLTKLKRQLGPTGQG